jgi:2-(1,2-epoxy-1,2-dihydrophenyl)acetyl-CoA isomerase
METEPRVLFEVDRRGVATATLNRPQSLNALDRATLFELDAVLARAWRDSSVRCLVLTGAGRGFCAGADVKEWSAGAANPEDDDWVQRMHQLMPRLYRLPKPVIAAVNGVAVGAGFDLALAADLRIASTNARFGSVYVNIGFCPDGGASFLLPRVVGPTRATELIFTGRIIGSEEADRIGLLSALVEPELFASTVDEWAGRLAAGPTVAIGLAKENLRENATLSLESALRSERRSGELCAETVDHAEGLKAVVEKRAPAFVGR